MASFQDGIAELERRVGHGDLVGSLAVDQPYAATQEVGYWKTGPLAGVIIRNHPGGGQSHALGDSLLVNAERYLRRLSYEPFEPRGLVTAMIDNVEDLAAEYRDRAPRESGALSDSGHPTVTDDGETAYDRPPVVPRLSGGERHPTRRSHFTPAGRLRR